MKYINLISLLVVSVAIIMIYQPLLSLNKAVFIVGVHRSGTSATAGVLQILGLPLGEDEHLLGPGLFNEKGHFEHGKFVAVNNGILHELNSSWRDTKPLALDFNSPKAVEFKERIKANLVQYLANKPIFGFKDPRLCLLLPLYLQASRELGYMPVIIIVQRKPLEIAASLAKRNEMPQDEALTLIRKYRQGIWSYTKGYRRIMVPFDKLVNNPLATIARLRRFLPELVATVPSRKQLQNKQVLDFISKDLKHHNLASNNRVRANQLAR